MPPYLSMPYFHLSKLPTTTKVMLTCFSTAIVTAILFVTIGVFGERTDYETKNVKANYAGDERVTKETGETFPDRMYSAPSRRMLYDIVHPHSFMMPIIYFILCHLMEMTGGSRAFKMALYLVAFVTMMVVVFAPLLVSWKLGMAAVVIPSVVLMSVAFLIMAVLPVWQMWMGKAEGKA